MNSDQLLQGIRPKFTKSRILFWHDPDESYVDLLFDLAEPLSIEGIELLDMQHQSLLETKKKIELDRPTTKFLLYFCEEEPVPEEDWMLDIRLYSGTFFADINSMILSDLGISKMSLRNHIAQHKSFFNSAQRSAGLKRWIVESEDEDSLDLKMMAVLVKAESATFDDLLLKLFEEYANSLDGDGTQKKGAYQRLEAHGLRDSFWCMVEQSLSYQSEEPSISDLVMKLFCTELWLQITGDDKQWLQNNVLKSAAGRSSALAFLVKWRDSNRYSQHHDRIALYLDQRLEVIDRCASCKPDNILQCATFESIEKVIVYAVVQMLLDAVGDGASHLDRAQFELILSTRRALHWSVAKPETYGEIYQALAAAEQLVSLRYQYRDGFHFDSVKAMFDAYTEELFLIDQNYRRFNEHAIWVKNHSGEVLQQLRDAVEELYSNWYLYELGVTWDRLLEQDQMLDQWSITGVPAQQSFFKEQIQKRLERGKVKRLFVIVSDALRYEVGAELLNQINLEKRFKAEITAQLGVLPSYTQLGMAALLPHESLTIDSAAGAPVRVDGKSSSGIDNRNAILSSFDGVAINAKELMQLSAQEARDRVRDFRVVYIYHDEIDSIGDKAATEEKTFDACRAAVTGLNALVARVINSLKGSRVLVTADHGFLYRQQAMEAADKTGLNQKPSGVYEAKKRYQLGHELPEIENCWKGTVVQSAGASCGSEFLLPKGSNRFHFVGGARFVHGGAMPQEIVVPIITVSSLQKKKAAENAKKRVGVVVMTQPIKFVNNMDKVRFVQSDVVGDQFISRALSAVIVDGEGQPVSSDERLVFDSQSENMNERMREVTLKLIGGDFDRTAHYQLVLTDSEDGIEYQRYPVSIDLAFQDDFF
jgi:uncharacterized protein (TIGR02687 family)